MKIFKIIILLSTMLFLLGIMACAPNPEFKLYEGRGLNIAVIGEIP